MRGGAAWAIFLRGLLVQASWSFERMQGPGFFLMSWPALRRRHAGDAAALARAGAGRLRHFNTHPYFAGLVAATVAREEEQGREPAQTEELARALSSALAAIGDAFFWAHLRPLAALAALPFALAGRWWAPLVLLALYGVPHVGVRAWGAVAGLARGRGVLAALQRAPLTRAVPALGVALAVLAGFLAGALAGRPGWALLPGNLPGSAAGAAATLAAGVALLGRGVPPQRLLGGAVAAAAAGGVFLVVLGP